MLKKLYIPILLILNSLSGFSQKIDGKITDLNGNPIAGANIYVKELSMGSASNVEGKYFLNLPKGKWTLQYRYIGCQTKDLVVETNDKDLEIDVALAPQIYQLKEIRVLPNGEDPAYYVMRKAISMGNFYSNQISKYTNMVYLKGSGRIVKIPGIFRKKLAKEGIAENKTYVTENISKIHFEFPNQIEEEVISIRSSEFNEQANPMQFVTINLYDTKNEGFISPLDKSAFSVYDFELESIFEDQGRTINKIKIMPKRKGKDLFRGFINIAENYWNIHSADLKLSPPMAHVEMQQIYAPIKNEVWMPVHLNIGIDFKGMGFEMEGKYVASIKDYEITLNPELNCDFITQATEAEITKKVQIEAAVHQGSSKIVSIKEHKRKKKIQALIGKDNMSNADMRKLNNLMRKDVKEVARKNASLEIKTSRVKLANDAQMKDSLFWNQMRPIPLSDEEKNSFKEKDSLKMLRQTQNHQDSLQNRKYKFTLNNFLTGKKHQFTKSKIRLSTPGLLRFDKLSFNTVQGFTFHMPFAISKADSLGRYLSLTPDFTYAFSREHLDFSLGVFYRYNGMKRASFFLKSGSEAVDFNQNSGIDPLLNAVSSLHFKDNYMKLFDKNYVYVQHQTDICNGLQLTNSLKYENRKTLFNNTSFYLTNPNHNTYSSNIPMGVDSLPLIQNHSALLFELELKFTPRHQYYIKNHRKHMLSYHNQPEFSVKYKQGIKEMLGSDTDYSLFEITVNQNINLGFRDLLSYQLKGGKYLSNPQMYFADFTHFNTTKPTIMLNSKPHSFRLLNDYQFSTNDDFVEAHVQFISDRLLLKRLPFLNQSLSICEKVFANYLTHSNKKNYWEVGYALSQIFLLFDIELVCSFDGKHHQNTGMKLRLGL